MAATARMPVRVAVDVRYGHRVTHRRISQERIRGIQGHVQPRQQAAAIHETCEFAKDSPINAHSTTLIPFVRLTVTSSTIIRPSAGLLRAHLGRGGGPRVQRLQVARHVVGRRVIRPPRRLIHRVTATVQRRARIAPTAAAAARWVLVGRQLVIFGGLLRLDGRGRRQQGQPFAKRRRVRRVRSAPAQRRIEPGQVLQTRQRAQLVRQFAAAASVGRGGG